MEVGLYEFACTAANTFCARKSDSGARQSCDDVNSSAPSSRIPSSDFSGRGRLARCSSTAESGRARFSPTVVGSEPSVAPPMSTGLSLSIARPATSQTSAEPSRTTINTPGVPAYLCRVSIFSTHAPHTKLSYKDAVMSGGGRPEEDASECTSSSSSGISDIWTVAPFGLLDASGDGSREEGRSRKLRQDS